VVINSIYTEHSEVADGKYIIGYNGCGVNDHYKLGFAESTDLVNWTKYSENPVMDLGVAGSWDDYRVENTVIAKDDIGTDSIRLWYFGCPDHSGTANCGIGYATCDQNAIKVEGTVDWVNRWQSGSETSYSIDTERLKLKTSVVGWANGIYSQDAFIAEKAIRYRVTFNSVGDADVYTGLSKDSPLTDWIFFFNEPGGLRYKNTIRAL
jgi:hypothetical protein